MGKKDEKTVSIDVAIKSLLKATETDPDPISCLVLGHLRDGFANSQGVVFVIRDGATAETVYKLLLNKEWTSAGPALTEPAK